MSIDRNDVTSQYLITELEKERGFRLILPILVVLLAPITVMYGNWYEPVFSVSLFFGQLDYMVISGTPYISFIISSLETFVLISVPALFVGIAASGSLRRLANRKTDKRRTLMEIIGVTVVWTIYLFVMFFGFLSIGLSVVGPIPVPLGPLVAALSRDYIIKVTE